MDMNSFRDRYDCSWTHCNLANVGSFSLQNSSFINLFVCSSIQHLLLVTVCCDEQGFPDGSSGKESAYKVGDTVDADLFPGLGRSSAGEWQPPPGFLPGKSHGQRSLAGYIPWGHKRVGHNLVDQTTTERIYSLENT